MPDTGLDTAEATDGTRYVSWPGLVWRRFRRRPLALLGAGLLALMLLLAFFGPMVSPGPAPSVTGTWTPEQVAEAAHTNAPPQTWPLSWRYLMGSTDSAQPVMWYLLDGGRAPVTIGILGALLASLIGIVSGAISGYLGGWTDTIWMRIADAFLAMPFIPLVLLATTTLNTGGIVTGVTGYTILFGLLGWPAVARLVRGYVLSMREWEFVLAARATGLSEPAVLFRHVVPNILGMIVVSFTLNIAVFIGAEVAIEFLGGPSPGAVTWGGGMVAGYSLLLYGEWWVVFFPAVAVVLTILAVNLLGDGLRDAIELSSLDGAIVMQREPRRALALIGYTGRYALARLSSARAHAARSLLPLAVAAGRLGMLLAPVRRTTARPPLWAQHPRLARTSPERNVPRWLALAPLALAFVLAGAAFLAGHAPGTYAPNYPSPVRYAPVAGGVDFGAQPLPSGGWALFSIEASGRLVYRRIDAHGHTLLSQTVAANLGPLAEPSLASGPSIALGVWRSSASGQATLWGVYVGAAHRRPRPFRISTSGSIEHSFALHTPQGFDVLFDQKNRGGYGIYMAVLAGGATRPDHVARLVYARNPALLPQAVIDGRGHLDAIYIELCCNQTEWNLELRRFTPTGRPLGPPQTVTQNPVLPTGNGAGGAQGASAPPSWPMAIARAPDGTVWAAAVGTGQVIVGHWSAQGRTLLSPRPLCGTTTCLDAQNTLALAFVRGQPFIFSITSSLSLDPQPYGAHFDRLGVVGAPERIAYDYGGGASNVHAGAAGATASVLWEKDLYGGRSVVEGTTYEPARRPDLASLLALNVGPAWANAAVVAVGSLVGGSLLTAINVFLLTLLILLWAVISRLFHGPIRWPLFVIGLTVTLSLVFAVPSRTPGFVFLLPAWHAPYGWIAAGGAAFTSAWTGWFLLRGQDGWFRAAVMALVAVFFIATMAAAVGIQAELAQV